MTIALIVDDRQDSQLVLSKLLEQEGFQVCVAETAIGILELVISNPPHLILLDLNLPELDGCEATSVLRSHEATSEIPIILCTAHLTADDTVRAKDAGCNAILSKPFGLAELRPLLAKLFGEKQPVT